MFRAFFARVLSILLGVGVLTTPFPVIGQSQAESPNTGPPVRVSLREAVEAGLVRGFVMRLAVIERDIVAQQIRGAWAEVLPKLDGFIRYDRTLETPNPFAGSNVADFFGTGGTSDWVVFNERIRAGGAGLDPAGVGMACPAAVDASGNLQQIGFGAYIDCVNSGQLAAGATPVDPDDNPFLVENNVQLGLSFSQLLYSGSAFASLRGVRYAREASEADYERTSHQVVREVSSAYFAVLLSTASVEVLKKSVARARTTLEEVQSRVREGVVPKFQELSSEVELANLETELLNAQDDAADAEETLSMAIGVPVGQPLELTDPLELPSPLPPPPPTVTVAAAEALQSRPDIAVLQASLEVERATRDATFARFFPELKLVANLAVVGNIPDDRQRVFGVLPTDTLLTQNPFLFESEDRGIFDSDFWGTNFTVGLNLTWTLFDGFLTPAQYDEQRLAVRRAQIRLEQLEERVRMEVASERRRLLSALERIRVQDRNIERAELNYRHAELRVREGVSSRIELREASAQLDQSRFNQLRAVHDYLVARIGYEVAVGRPPVSLEGASE